MAILPIRFVPDPILKQPAKPVEVFDSALRKLLGDMTDTMYHAHGIGLAGPQVGVSQRLAVVHVDQEHGERMFLVNPVITAREGTIPSEEGCLSIPEFRDTIQRSERIAFTFQDHEGKTHSRDADGLLAICIQHEIDHLDGILFVDHLSRLKREFYRRWLKRFTEDAPE